MDYSYHFPMEYIKTLIFPENGTFVYLRRIRQKYRCGMDFFWYPFDIVSCQLELESLEPINKITFGFVGKELVKNVTDLLDAIGGSNLEGWILTDNNKWSKNVQKGGKNVSVLVENFEFRRVYSQELLQTIIPSLLLSLVSSSSVFMHHELLPARMGVAATTFLSMISLFKMSSSERPKTAHLKMIDFWMILCYFGAFFCFGSRKKRIQRIQVGSGGFLVNFKIG